MESARVDVLGVQVSAVNQSMALEAVTDWTRRRDRQYVCVTGVHGVMESIRDPELRDIHNGSGMTTPDGMPMVWAGRRAGAGWMDRVYGPDLMLAVCERAAVEGWSSYFYGAAPGVADQLATRLLDRFPGLAIAGTHSPPFRPLTEDEAEAEVRMINAAAPDLVWVGLSTPKQERWMARRRPHLEAPVLLGVGAAFDINAGLVAQAPDWMQRSGLEWAFRLGKEPRRLWRRYLRNNPSFVVRIVRHPPKLVV
jgi:N-acetylglucosaminyldiphosphoundecaprenol N-acetyl-beta-D-mannosaminyltransferase